MVDLVNLGSGLTYDSKGTLIKMYTVSNNSARTKIYKWRITWRLLCSHARSNMLVIFAALQKRF